MVTTLYLIRHGATEGGEVKRYKGTIDAALNIIEFWDKYPVVKLINGIING